MDVEKEIKFLAFHHIKIGIFKEAYQSTHTHTNTHTNIFICVCLCVYTLLQTYFTFTVIQMHIINLLYVLVKILFFLYNFDSIN